MRLRLDHLLTDLHDRPADILAAIDNDPLLFKRESGGLVLANAGKELFTPQQEHQLFAKGIVYRRAPYRLVSLPLIKIYNAGERDVTVRELSALAAEPDMHLRFLRKIDGSLIQVFRADGRVWFTTRGMIDGAIIQRNATGDSEERADFDYLGTARRLAETTMPRLFTEADTLLDGRTLLFEFIHPAARVVTNYGDRAELILLTCFDQRRVAYLPYPEVQRLGERYGLPTVDALSPQGGTLDEQIGSLLASLAGTDQEGSVLTFERHGEVIYRVKVKSPDYLHLMRLMSRCTYETTVTMVEEQKLTTWPQFEVYLRELGRERVPEEVLATYQEHFDRYTAYLADCDRVLDWARRTHADLVAQIGAKADAKAYRKSYAALASKRPCSGLLFAALDGQLDRQRVRKMLREPQEATQALAELGL
jgi:RNA ligase